VLEGNVYVIGGQIKVEGSAEWAHVTDVVERYNFSAPEGRIWE